MSQRPTSPHVTVYRIFRYTLFTSIFNRFTGVVLSAGLLILAYWLLAVASGGRAYDHALAILSLGIFKLVYLGLILSFSYHLVAGIRHLIWDTGHGLEREQSKRSAGIVVTVSVLLLVVLAYVAFFSGAHQS